MIEKNWSDIFVNIADHYGTGRHLKIREEVGPWERVELLVNLGGTELTLRPAQVRKLRDALTDWLRKNRGKA